MQETRAGESMRGDDKLTLRRHRSVHHPSLYIPAALQQPISNLLAVSCPPPPSPFPPFLSSTSAPVGKSESVPLPSSPLVIGAEEETDAEEEKEDIDSLSFVRYSDQLHLPLSLMQVPSIPLSLSLSLFAKRETNPPSLPGGSLPFSPPPSPFVRRQPMHLN